MANKMFVFRKYLNTTIDAQRNGHVITDERKTLLLSTLVYFSTQFTADTLMKLGITDFTVYENDGIKFIRVKWGESDYVAFRGTEFSLWSNVRRVLRCVPRRKVNGMQVHAGFADAYKMALPMLDWSLDGRTDIVFTGHSMGGALASIAGAGSTRTRKVITYASPHFLLNMKSRMTFPFSHIGFHVKGDIVPHLPPSIPWLEWSKPLYQIMWICQEEYFNIIKYHHIAEMLTMRMEFDIIPK